MKIMKILNAKKIQKGIIFLKINIKNVTIDVNLVMEKEMINV